MEQQEIDKLTIFRSYYDALKQRNDTDFATMFRAIFEYGFQGVEPTFEDASLAAIFTLIRPVLKRSIARASAGASGGRSGAGVARNFCNNHASKNNSKNNSIEAAEKEKENGEGIGEGEGNMEKEKKKKNRRFTRPTVEEVKAYCIERNNGIDAQSFVDFYESKGWKVGNSAMKDWKACVRTWESRNGRKPAKEGVLLGVDEWIDADGKRRYGTGNMPPVPMCAPPRPNKNTIFSRESNTWIPAGL